MGDDLARGQRGAVRTPLQWSDEPNGGFSPASSDRLHRDSLLARVGKMCRSRLGMRELGLGVCRVMGVGCAAVLALRHDHKGTTAVTLVNLSPDDVVAPIPDENRHDLVDLLSDAPYDPLHGSGGAIPVRGYGYRWLRPRDRLLGPA